jgi:3'-5' exoribonuclease
MTPIQQKWISDARGTIDDYIAVYFGVENFSSSLEESYPAFFKIPASHKYHHAYEGGLAVHTAEVMDLIHEMSIDTDNMKVLILSALLHDMGKILDYTLITGDADLHRELIGHSVSSNLFATFPPISELWNGLTWDEERIGVIHAIISHHGKPEWGAVMLPKTQEAHLLHRADMISAYRGDRMKLPKEADRRTK